MKGADIQRDLDRALSDANEVVEVLTSERATIEVSDPYNDTYASKIQRIVRECYDLRNFVRDQLG